MHHSEETRNLCDPPLKSVLRTRCYHIIGTQMWSAHWSSFLSISSALSLMSSPCIISLFINLIVVSIANDWLPFLVFVAGSATNTRKWQTTNTSKWQTTNTRKWHTTGVRRPGQQNHWRHCQVVRPNGLQFENRILYSANLSTTHKTNFTSFAQNENRNHIVKQLFWMFQKCFQSDNR